MTAFASSPPIALQGAPVQPASSGAGVGDLSSGSFQDLLAGMAGDADSEAGKAGPDAPDANETAAPVANSIPLPPGMMILPPFRFADPLVTGVSLDDQGDGQGDGDAPPAAAGAAPDLGGLTPVGPEAAAPALTGESRPASAVGGDLAAQQMFEGRLAALAAGFAPAAPPALAAGSAPAAVAQPATGPFATSPALAPPAPAEAALVADQPTAKPAMPPSAFAPAREQAGRLAAQSKAATTTILAEPPAAATPGRPMAPTAAASSGPLPGVAPAAEPNTAPLPGSAPNQPTMKPAANPSPPASALTLAANSPTARPEAPIPPASLAAPPAATGAVAPALPAAIPPTALAPAAADAGRSTSRVSEARAVHGQGTKNAASPSVAAPAVGQSPATATTNGSVTDPPDLLADSGASSGFVPLEPAAVETAEPGPQTIPLDARPVLAPGETLASVPPPAPRGLSATVAKLAADILHKLDGQSTRFELKLDPGGLGRVDVSIEIGADGRLTAAMAFDTPQAAADLRSRASELRQMLEQAGFDLSENALSFDLAGQGGGWAEREAADQGRAWSGRAFRALQQGLDEAEATLAASLSDYSRPLSSGVDIRI